MITEGPVLGLDACKGGWAGIAWSGGSEVHGVFGSTVGDAMRVARRIADMQVVAIDIPIGLPDSTARAADRLARTRVGDRRASVFTTPVRAALEMESYADALAVNRRVVGKGLSRQAYGLRDRIRQVETFVGETKVRVVEVHPEVSFAEMNGGPVDWPKTTWHGLEQRRRLLRAQGIEVPVDLGDAGDRAGPDDVLDAAAAAWTAMRVRKGGAYSLPEKPERFSDGLEAAIWV